MIEHATIYQDAAGDWIVFDGTYKQHFGDDETAARRYFERLGKMSVLREWAELNQKLLDQAQDIIDATARPRRLGQANDIPAQIAATADGDEVGDSGLTKERAAAINAMWDSFEDWLATPLEGVNLAPIQILSMRDT